MSISSTSASLSIHAAFLALLLFLSTREVVKKAIRDDDGTSLFFPRDLLLPRSPAPPQPIPGGTGGGRMPLPAAQGMFPPPSAKVFVAPQQVRQNDQPLLELPPSLDIPPQTPNLDLAHWGDPSAPAGGPLSNGHGGPSGIGEGPGRSIGSTPGNRYGPGAGPGGGVRSIGGGVTAPRLIYKIEPEYSEEARKARYQGPVMLRVIVDEQGAVRHVEVSHALGLGLDEKAVEAVRKWRFQPGRQNGKAVPVWAVVEVFFRLL